MAMDDLYLDWSGDLSVDSTGDLALVTGPDLTRQRLYRRLVTNPGDYLWNLGYGGGLAQFVGVVARPYEIEAVIRDQLDQEPLIATDPVPEVAARVEDAADGNVVASIIYTALRSEQSVQLDLRLSR